MIRLDEGVRMLSNVIGTTNDRLHVDMKVEVVFEPATDEISIPKFRPAQSGEA
jgi:uncharacterized OB-fold protein